MRDPARIERICEALRVAWRRYPDERLGQFLINSVGHDADIWNLEDNVWEDEIYSRLINNEIRQHRWGKRLDR